MAQKKTTTSKASTSQDVPQDVPQDVQHDVQQDVPQDSNQGVTSSDIPPVQDASTKAVDQQASDTTDKFVSVLETLQTFQTQFKDLITQVKFLHKEHLKLQKQKGKKAAKKKTEGEDGVVNKRQPSGFAKPTKLSAALCDFLGVPLDTMMARTEVTRILNEYIKKHDLQDKTDRRKIIPNEELSKILILPEDSNTHLSYFTLQSSIKSHFIK